MTIEEVVVRQVLGDEHADVMTESVRAVAQQPVEAEVSELIGATLGERTDDRATHRNGDRVALGHQGRGDGAADPKDPSGQLLPELPAAAQAQRAGACLCRPAGLMSAVSRPGGSISSSRASVCAQQERGQPHRRATRRAGPSVPRAAVRRAAPLPVRRRQGREGPRRRARRQQVRGRRAWCPGDRTPRDHRPRRRRG